MSPSRQCYCDGEGWSLRNDDTFCGQCGRPLEGLYPLAPIAQSDILIVYLSPAPAPPRPVAPDSWQTSLGVRIPEEVEVEDGDEEGPGVTLPEGTDMVSVLAAPIKAPDAGLNPDLNRVKVVLAEDVEADGVVLLPKGSVFLGKVQQTTDKKVHPRIHRVVLPDGTALACEAVVLDDDATAGLTPDRVERFRKRNLLSRVASGALGATTSVLTLGHGGAGALGAGAAEGTIEQGREEATEIRKPTKVLHVEEGRTVIVQLTADLRF